jgi:protein-tyrosine phosphatase
MMKTMEDDMTMGSSDGRFARYLRFATAFLILAVQACAPEAQEETPPSQESSSVVEVGHSLGINSVPNLREVGGFRTSDGTVMATGLLYRSNQLHGITPEDMERIEALGLVRDFDLRTEEERDLRPDEVPEGTEYVWLNVLEDAEEANPAILERLMSNPAEANAALGDGQAEQGFIDSYRQFVSLPSAQREFGRLFEALSDRDQLPALYHCTTGKDRTGWASAALLTLLGVPRDVVMEDYLRSNDYIIPAYQEVIDGFVADGGQASIPLAILGVKAEYLEASFDEMEARFGTIENYFAEGLGIDAAGQESLRAVFLGG